jgi:hypothetical protein
MASTIFCSNLPKDGRLPDPLHRLAHQTSYQEQQNDLSKEKRLRWSLHPLLSSAH